MTKQTDTHTDPSTVTLAAHACRGLIIASATLSSLEDKANITGTSGTDLVGH